MNFFPFPEALRWRAGFIIEFDVTPQSAGYCHYAIFHADSESKKPGTLSIHLGHESHDCVVSFPNAFYSVTLQTHTM